MAHRYDSSSWRDGPDASTYALAQGLGWFSIGLGMAEVLAPGHLARFLGMEERTELIRAYGAREIMSGIGILAQQDPTPWIWARVGGDALDLATLATGLRRRQPAQAKRDGSRSRGGRRHGAGCDLCSAAEQCAPEQSRDPAPAASERLQRPARHAPPARGDARRRKGLRGSPGYADPGGDASLHHGKFA